MTGRADRAAGRRGWRSWALRLALFGLVLMLVLYPRPDLMVRNVLHWWDLDALADPTVAALDPLEQELRAGLAGARRGGPELLAVQTYVERRIPYAFDWDLWGVVDYVPTVEETIRAGKEDCDGRAVLAAALLKRLGYDARMRCDGSHVWVWTPEGETMHPMRTASGRTLVSTSGTGTSVDWRALVSARAALVDVPTDLAYGVAVFPVSREAIVLGAMWVLVLPRGRVLWWGVVGLVALVGALVVIRQTSADPWHRSVGGAWWGIGLCFAGMLSAGGVPTRILSGVRKPTDQPPEAASARPDGPYSG